MSETSEEKTKRKYLTVLRGYQWSYQHSVFYDKPEQSHALLEHMVKFKQVLRRRCPDQPFLVRIQTLKKGAAPHQAYLTIFTTKKVEDLQEMANKVFPAIMNVMGKRLSVEKLDQIARAIEKQKPHDLSKVLDKAGINRWSVLNKHLLVPLSCDNSLEVR
ncbi:hypothetical protein RGV59_06250 [Pseudomonas sp. FG1]|uniref:hypothetical protein n=1 Tax=Pseudomonas sp. FG1 TaxID=3048624 RepID=UPI002AB570D3|nr:hypothetical protein [Pseudomonas sp. FG1]MDY7550440.1 hypothetical protein [Pseudomonas sp. FG1]MEB0049458.1 hypothetical protein [Pseudomonas sp. FG1]